MAEYFTENLIDHRKIALRPYRVPELPLDRTERALDVRPLVIMLDVFVILELEVVEDFLKLIAYSPV